MQTSVYNKIINLFHDNNINYEEIRHAPVTTSEEAAMIRSSDISIGAKALVFLADGDPVLLVLAGNRKVDNRKFKELYKIKDLRMATLDEVMSIASVERGAVPPLGSVMEIPSYFDKSLQKEKRVAFNAGSREISIYMDFEDLVKIENPLFGDFSKEKQS